MTRALVLLTLALIACGPPSSEPGAFWNPLRREVPEFGDGIRAYQDSRWADAEQKFQDANDRAPSSAGHFDLGAAQYKQKKNAEAADNFRKVLTSMNEDDRERAYFNLGNTSAASGDLQKAMEEYRRALELRPNDMDARYNLEWAQRMLEEAKKKNDEGKKDDQQQDQEKKDEKNEEQQAKNDKKDGDQEQKDAEQKKDQEKENGEEKKAENDKKEGGDQKEHGTTQGEEKKAENDKKDGEQQPADQGEEKKEEENPSGEPREGMAAKGNEKPLDRRQTAAILDSLQAGEKNLQMWKFQQNGKPAAPRSESDKPW